MIRGYVDNDYGQLKSLYKHREWYGGVFDEARDGRARLSKKITQDPESILVYEEATKLLGTVSIVEDGRVAWLYRFVVQDLDRVISQKLYDAATAVLKARGHREVLVYSTAGDASLDEHYVGLDMHKGGKYTCFWRAL